MLEKRIIWFVVAACALAVVLLELKSQRNDMTQLLGFCAGVVVLVYALIKNWRLYFRGRRKPLLH
jgi:uncharacterized membrane protein